MLKLKVTRGLITLKITENSNYQLVSVTGLNPPVADIAVSESATADGGVFNIARAQKRNIVLQIQPIGNIETRRLQLYSYFAPKAAITLDIQTDNRHVTIDGYVESMEVDYNANPQIVQVSIICPDPFFVDKTQSSTVIPGTVTNPSEASQGAEFTINCTGSGSSIVLGNSSTNESLTITDTFANGNVIKIVTEQGKKMVTKGGVNIMSKVNLSSDWPQLQPGDNTITITGVTCTATCKFYPKYMGV